MQQKLVNVLQKCQNVRQIKQTHDQIIVHGLKDCNFIVPKLMSLSSDFISPNYAANIFGCVCTPNVVTYNNLIKCFIGKSHTDAIFSYNRMREAQIMPNSFTFTSLFRCLEFLDDGKCVHGQVMKLGFLSSVFVHNTILDFYSKCGGNLGYVWMVFDEMVERDVISYNTMIGACMNHGEVEFAIRLFEGMPERNTVTWNSVIGGLSKTGNVELARTVFNKMPQKNTVSWNSMVSGYIMVGDMRTAQALFDEVPEKSVVSWTAMVTGYATVGDLESARRIFDQMQGKNVVSWNAMIAGYVNGHMFDQALSVFHNMLVDGNCKPNQVTLISALSACSHLGAHDHGKWIDGYIKKNNVDLSVPLGNGMIDMFAKCGDLPSAWEAFHKMPKKCIITWTTMISGLAVNGHCSKALELFYRMCRDGLKPDDVIFIAVLTACVHGGLLEDGNRVFDLMVKHYEIKPRIEHYGCMVDLLGRAGKLEEAVRFTESMHLQPNAVIWATLLAACKIHGNGELLESLTDKILASEPTNPGYLTLITNISSSIGRWQNALNFRLVARQQGAEKVPGCSAIQIGSCVHEFLAKDTKHAQKKEIYQILGNLNGELKSVYDMPVEYTYS
ncbi:hypothetical protein LIER_37354 [Lithospermum erythrorhizon]|uniref:Pentatricopeptide repeat-containing protein n=1 Tax=Lithospermum erythrorhizon TaxID=34254 RepID=A0AAV3PP87_LITER